MLARLYMIYIGEDSLECRVDVRRVGRGGFYELHAVFRCKNSVGKLLSRLRLEGRAHRQMLLPLQS